MKTKVRLVERGKSLGRVKLGKDKKTSLRIVQRGKLLRTIGKRALVEDGRTDIGSFKQQ